MSSRLETKIRVALALCALLAVVFAPWWMPLLFMFLLSIRFPAWEVPLIGLTMDLMWMPGGHLLPLYTIFAVVLVWLMAPMRKQFLL